MFVQAHVKHVLQTHSVQHLLQTVGVDLATDAAPQDPAGAIQQIPPDSVSNEAPFASVSETLHAPSAPSDVTADEQGRRFHAATSAAPTLPSSQPALADVPALVPDSGARDAATIPASKSSTSNLSLARLLFINHYLDIQYAPSVAVALQRLYTCLVDVYADTRLGEYLKQQFGGEWLIQFAERDAAARASSTDAATNPAAASTPQPADPACDSLSTGASQAFAAAADIPFIPDYTFFQRAEASFWRGDAPNEAYQAGRCS